MKRQTPRLHCFATTIELYEATAQAFGEAAHAAIATRGRFTVALAGGSTPRALYERLAQPPYRDAVNWRGTEIFFGDERCVPPDHADSNARMARAALLDHIIIPPDHIHRMRGEDEAHRAAHAYVRELRQVFGREHPPCFDLILLGIGANGHTASLFPGTGALRERRRSVCAQYVEVQQQWRLTLTYPTLNAARAVWVLAKGTDKAEAVQHALEGPHEPEVWPIQGVTPQGSYLWWLDEAAAARLNGIN